MSNFSFARCSLAYSSLQTWAGIRMSASLWIAESFTLFVRFVTNE